VVINYAINKSVDSIHWHIKTRKIYLNKLVSHHMYGEGFQGVDLHDKTHIPEVD
jgi:hypothetical protein